MATDVRVIEDSGTVVVTDSTRYPAYTSKADILRDLIDAQGGGRLAIEQIIRKLSNTDTGSALTDKASRAQ